MGDIRKHTHKQRRVIIVNVDGLKMNRFQNIDDEAEERM